MKLNRKGFFVNRFLIVDIFKGNPNTFCELVLVTLKSLLIWTIGCVILALILYGFVGFASMLLNAYFGFEIPWKEFPGIDAGLVMAMVAVGITAFLGIAALIYEINKRVKSYKHSNEPKEPSVVMASIRAAKTRLKDKACVLIEYE